MKGVGGPLLCIGDLLSDLGDENDDVLQSPHKQQTQSSSSVPDSSIDENLSNIDLTNIFQENFSRLNDALAGTDHSWIPLTLQLCTAVETANKLVQSTNSSAKSLSEKVEDLKKIIKKGDSVVAAAKAVNVSLDPKGGSYSGGRRMV